MKRGILGALLILTLLLILQQSICIHAQLTSTLTASNNPVDSRQTETLTANVSGGVPPYTVNFFNVTGNRELSSSIYTPSWIQTNSYPTNDSQQSCVTTSNDIYCIGGTSSQIGYDNSVYYAQILSSGELGAWIPSANSYPTNDAYQSCVNSSGTIYCIGGNNDQIGYDNAIYYAQILGSADIGTWTQSANSYPTNVESQKCVNSSNTIYCIGGATTQLNYGYDNAIYYAQILGSGDIGAWTQSANSYPTNANEQSCVTSSDVIYCIGGYISAFGNENAIYYAQILGSGDIGAWTQSANSYPTNDAQQSCVTSSNTIYCIGGETNQLSGYDNAVYYSPILGSGELGSWSNASYPKNNADQSCVSESNKIYCIGGYATQLGGASDNSVYFTPILNSGALATSPPTYTFTANSPTSDSVFQYNTVVTDSTPTITNSVANSIIVNTALIAGDISPNSPTLYIGQSTTLSANPSGGTLSYTYQWYSNPGSTATCSDSAIGDATGPTYSTNPTSTTTSYAYLLTDLAGENICSNPDTVTVNTALGPPTLIVSNAILDSGQIETLTAEIYGGTGPYTVNFFNVTGNKQLSSSIYAPWTPSSNSYPTNDSDQSCVTTSNTIYCIGGFTSQLRDADNAIYYAPILNSGEIGSWIYSTNSYPTNDADQSCITTSNNIYCIRGDTSMFGNDKSVYYAPILSSGELGAWTPSANSYPTNNVGQSCVTTSNTIYCIGGETLQFGIVKSVYYAPILSSGDVGAWTLSTNSYPTDVQFHSCVTASINIYCIGGYTTQLGYDNSVYYSPILDSGELGAWTPASNSYPTNVFTQSCVSASNTIYCIGGATTQLENGDGIDDAIYYASILSSGEPSSWKIALYPTNDNDQSCVSASNIIYCIGGITTQLGYSEDNSVYYTKILNLGALPPSTLPSYSFTANSPTKDNVFQYNAIVTDSTSTATNSIPKSITVIFPTITLTPSVVEIKNNQEETLTANIMGGVPGYSLDFFNLTGSKNAAIFSYQKWLSTSSYPTNVVGQSCVASSNTIYCIGGETTQLGYDNSVYYAPILGSGTLGTWTPSANSYPTNNAGQSCITSSNDIYCIGGYNHQLDMYDNLVYYTPIINSGDLGAWTPSANSYPTNVVSQSCVSTSNKIYCIGGYTSQSDYGNDNSVYYAPILGSGDLGAWTPSLNSYPTNVQSQSCINTPNTIYCIGGLTTQLEGNPDNSIYYAKILGSGDLGAWTSTTRYPTNNFGLNCTIGSSTIYCIGGGTTQLDYNPDNSVYYAPILGSGAIGSWSPTTGYPTNNIGTSCVLSSKNIYCIGGATTQLNYDSDNSVYYAPISDFGVANSLNYSFIADSPTTNNALQFNVSVTDSGTPLTANSIPNTIIVNYAAQSTTTIPQGGGGGGGSSGGLPGGSGGGSSKPIITNVTYTYNNNSNSATLSVINGTKGYQVTNFAAKDSETFDMPGDKAITITVSSISPTKAVLIINGASYNLTLGVPISIDPPKYTYYVLLENISYIPIEQTLTVGVFSKPLATSNTTSTKSSTTILTTTTLPSNIVQSTSSIPATITQTGKSAYSTSRLWVLAIAILAIILAVYYLYSRGKKEPSRKKRL